jgi:hypothetical protein
MEGEQEPNALEYFSGGVPANHYFRLTLGDLGAISEADKISKGINRLQEICFIGLLAYFEAFCKDHFASILNIEPTLIRQLKQAGQDVLVDASHVALYGRDCQHRLGFVVANKFDFGTPKKINALFNALLGISPLSKDEAKKFDALLRDRHLLVHHGGTFTLAYLEQQAEKDADIRQNAFFNSRVINKAEVSLAISSVEKLAKKLTQSSFVALTQYLAENGIVYSGERAKALRFLEWDES